MAEDKIKAKAGITTKTDITTKETVDTAVSEQKGETSTPQPIEALDKPSVPNAPGGGAIPAEPARMAQPVEPLNPEQPPAPTPAELPNDKTKTDVPADQQAKNQEAAEKAVSDNKPGEAKPAEPAAKTAAAGKSKGTPSASGGKGGAAVAAAQAAKSGDVKEAGKQALKKVVTEAIKKALAAALKYVIGFFGWPCLIIAIIIVIIMAVIALALFASASDGSLGGKSTPTPSGKDYPGVKTVLDAAKQGAKSSEGGGVAGHNLLGINDTDQKAIEDGLIDKRLLDALAYLSQRHLSLDISHIVSDYQNMKGESGANAQLQSNVSAHQEGLAADIATIDFVYKVHMPDPICSEGMGDLVYYSDQGAKIGTADTNTSTNPASGDTSASTGDVEAGQAEADAQAEAIDQILKEIQDTLDNKCAGSTNSKIIELKQKVAELRTKIVEFKNKLDEALKALKALQTGLNTATGIIQTAGQSVPSEFDEINRYLTLAIAHLGTINRTLASVIPVLQTATEEISQAVSENCAQVDEATAQTAAGQFDQVSASIEKLPDLPTLGNLSALGPVINEIVSQLQQIAAETLAQQLPDIIEEIKPDLGTLGSVLPTGSQELLRLYCVAKPGDINANTTFKGRAAEAIPIKVAWQDPKPTDTKYTDPGAKDDCLYREPILGPVVCIQVFRPEAQRKVHQVISELLQYPYDMGNKYTYRVRQIITFSYARDVKPFWDKLKDLYGLPRGENIGLFQMPEAWAQIHISY